MANTLACVFILNKLYDYQFVFCVLDELRVHNVKCHVHKLSSLVYCVILLTTMQTFYKSMSSCKPPFTGTVII